MTQAQSTATGPEGQAPVKGRINAVRARCAQLPAAAEYLGVGRSVLYKMMNEGKLKSLKIGGRRVIEYDELDRYIDAQIAASEAAA